MKKSKHFLSLKGKGSFVQEIVRPTLLHWSELKTTKKGLSCKWNKMQIHVKSYEEGSRGHLEILEWMRGA